MPRPALLLLLATLGLGACRPVAAPADVQTAGADPCPASTPVTDTPPDDPHADPFDAGPWFINADRSLWAFWGTGWQPGLEGNKVIWIQPAGARLEVSGRRLDGESAPLRVDIPEGYGTGFQVTGVYVPAQGCWEITAQAGASQLQFVAAVAPGPGQ